MAFRLIPREEKFFDDFTEMAVEIRKGAALLDEMLAPDHPVWEKDPIQAIKWKEILDMLEGATDRCKDVAKVLEAVYVKHS